MRSRGGWTAEAVAERAARSGAHQPRDRARKERSVMLNTELNASIQIDWLERERKQYLAQSQALHALAERSARPIVKPPSPIALLNRLWRAMAIPRRQLALRRAEAAA